MGRNSLCSLPLGNRIFGELPILLFAGVKVREKLMNLYQMETYVAIRTLYKPINKDFAPIRDRTLSM